jgi:sugar (pentulose or hexulose) kinase
VVRAWNASAAGAAIYAAVAAGAHPTVEVPELRWLDRGNLYLPDAGSVQLYASPYRLYRRLHDAFSADGTLGDVMKG